MSTQTQPQFFIPLALLDEARGILVEQLQAMLDAYERTPMRQRTPDERQAIVALRRDIAAYARQADYQAAGLFPTVLDDTWQIGSLSEPGTVHRIWRDELVPTRWACDCRQAGKCFHVHQAYMLVVELALDLADRYDSAATPAVPQSDPTPTPVTFSDGTPIPDEPDWSADVLATPYPTMPPASAARPYRPTPAPRLPYPTPRSSWQQWRNDEAARPARAEERAQLQARRAERAA